jgi:hypothetical protein
MRELRSNTMSTHPQHNTRAAIETVATTPPSRPALSRPLASHSFPVPFGQIKLPSYYTGDAQGRDEGSLPPPPLPEAQPPASLVLLPRPERSLRTTTPPPAPTPPPPHSAVRARGPNPRRSLGGPLLGVLYRICHDTARPRNAGAESRSTAVSRRACVTLHSPGFASLHFNATTVY